MASLPAAIRCLLILLLICSTSDANDEIKALIGQLGKGVPAGDRVAAAKKLRDMETREALGAIDALENNCTDDNADVRNAAVLALGTLLDRFEQPCHLSLVRAMFDADPLIRTHADLFVRLMAKRLPEDAVPLLLSQAAHRDPSIRSSVLETLAAAAGDDPTIRAVLRQAVHDRDYMVRNNVIVALFKQTGDLSAAVSHWLMLLDEPGNADAAKFESERQQFVQIGIAQHVRNLGLQRPKEMINALIPLLKDESPVVRGAAARTLGAIANDSDEARRLAVKLRVREELKPLLDDSVENVRANAAVGLDRLPK